MTRLLLIIVRLLAARFPRRIFFSHSAGFARSPARTHGIHIRFSLEHAFIGAVTCTCPGYHSHDRAHANARRKDCFAACANARRPRNNRSLHSNERLKRRKKRKDRSNFRVEGNEVRPLIRARSTHLRAGRLYGMKVVKRDPPPP